MIALTPRPAGMDADEARGATEAVRYHLVRFRAILLQLRESEGWRAAGYTSWDEFLNAEFGHEFRPR